MVRNGGRIGRDQRHGFEVLVPGGIDGRRGAVGQAGDAGLHPAGAEHLASLVGAGGDQRQPFRNAGMASGLGRDAAQALAGLEQLRQLLAANRHGLPFPVPRCGPFQALVVEGQVSDLAGHRVDEAPAQAMAEEARQQQHLVGPRPDFGLVLRHPVGLGLGAEVVHRGFKAHGLEQPAPRPLDAPAHLGLALVQPEDGRAQRLALLIHIDHRAALGGEGHTAYQPAVDAHRGPQQAARLAQAFPVVLGVLLRPAGLAGIVGFERHLALADQVAVQVEQQRAHALGAVVDGQQIALVAHDASLFLLCRQAVAALPEREVMRFFPNPAGIVPTQQRLAQGAYARQLGTGTAGQQQAESGAAQQQVVQVQHQFALRRPGQFGPEGIGGADPLVAQQSDPSHQLGLGAPMTARQAQALTG
ncbi:hypothetical protein D9M71_298780 [compost metagenome]